MTREHPMESQGPLQVGEEVRGLSYEDEKAWTGVAGCEEGAGARGCAQPLEAGRVQETDLPRVSQTKAAQPHLGFRPLRPTSHS